jgi:exopolyphosphatase/guanosine-5'-triphosphate,3'-diphosphate pyrophosphatase
VTNSARPTQVAAVDLGSNSFHMIVAELRANEIVVLDRLREMVRLGSGLTPERDLTPEIQQRALDCMERFGQRLRSLPPGSVRAVGTNTLRAARNAGPWLARAEQALGHPIEIISGIEEARLIYQGVSQSLPSDGKRRLVMDIGGGSTEYIIGVDQTPLQKESLRMGCVSMSMAHFDDGKITAKRFKRAVIAAKRELEPFEHLFHSRQWKQALGASGTLRTTQKLLQGRGWSREGISAEGLNRLVEAVIDGGRLNRNDFPDLDPERFPSFPGGLAIIQATFEALDIEHMQISDGALREGLLHDLLGRINHEDVRERTVQALAARYHVETDHALQIQATLKMLLDQLAFPATLDRDTAGQWLDWAAALHDIGRDIAHSGYHKHGAYILANADLPGFSNQDQLLLATLVRCHRRKFPVKLFKELSAPWDEQGRSLAVVLRMAILLHRSRALTQVPPIRLDMNKTQVRLTFPTAWLEEHPLTIADLEQEAGYLEPADINLIFR